MLHYPKFIINNFIYYNHFPIIRCWVFYKRMMLVTVWSIKYYIILKINLFYVFVASIVARNPPFASLGFVITTSISNDNHILHIRTDNEQGSIYAAARSAISSRPKRFHWQLIVLTSTPHYPTWRISVFFFSFIFIINHGVTIYRFPGFADVTTDYSPSDYLHTRKICGSNRFTTFRPG